ncbi:hypothetical protein GPECTOR_33g583 [Gonium pectorale]|uniref:Uncharacterized protein n=1 Tax=Gonium pectorale TaxID=33097 RepID=A0A150GCX3_GONPE|nr:hypothetical protein GPECTOR_33g583 [Gonium pectorale]|eukprot:KXZ47701.1 hypothetical protein GPECTOR_33g583 [Gonium pectorale]
MFEAMSNSADAFIRAAADGLPDASPPPPPPWGTCTQYLALAAATATLAAAGFGGGGGMGGAVVSSSGAFGLPPALAASLRCVTAAAASVPGPDLGDGGKAHEARAGGVDNGADVGHVFAVLLSMVEAETDRTAGRPGSAGACGGSSGGGGAGSGACGGGGGGGGGGSGCGGDDDGSGSGSDGARWSFLIEPRASHVLCMGIADLAMASGDAAAGSPFPSRRRRCWAPAALGTFRRGRSSGTPGARGRGARGAPAASDGGLVSAGMGRLPSTGVGQLLAMPCPLRVLTEGSLPAAPPADLAAALSCGVLPALEACARALGRSGDPEFAQSLGELLTGSLLSQPGATLQLLAFGPPGQVAPLLTSLGKVLHRGGGGEGGGGGTAGMALDSLGWYAAVLLASTDPRRLQSLLPLPAALGQGAGAWRARSWTPSSPPPWRSRARCARS